MHPPLKDMKYYNSFEDKPILRGTSCQITANLLISRSQLWQDTLHLVSIKVCTKCVVREAAVHNQAKKMDFVKSTSNLF
jgi:hypothetical protein